ncbi:hypothetical protein HDA40_005392 [Hamadaea flava]|uniref:hypothetical protein n=1 Tax=Hamadaea flava TaxID=1742688 RepID=UPI0020A43525|nr:hypothetical protein [Hamadaea flava]MCP2326885.1 hypothetical protein [Hamadaea flava]
MHQGLTVRRHDPQRDVEPDGWADFADKNRLGVAWAWPLVRAAAAGGRQTALIATLHDGPDVAGLVTGRFIGPRVSRGRQPIAGILDIDSLTTSCFPGIVTERPEAFGDAVDAVLTEVRGIQGVLLRQIVAETLPAVLRRPAVVREGVPMAHFANRFADFDAYAHSLGRRRGPLRPVYNRLGRDTDLVVESTMDGDLSIPVTAADLRRLVNLVVDRHHTRRWLRKRYLSEAVAAAQVGTPGVHLRTYRDLAGRLLAVHTVLDHPDLPVSSAWGSLDLADGGRKDLWFHSNAELSRWCIETGRRGFLSGQGSLAEKQRLGHETTRQWQVLIPASPRRRPAPEQPG